MQQASNSASPDQALPRAPVHRRPGTTLAAIVGGNNPSRDARVVCLDGGDRVVVTAGSGPDVGAVAVATSNAVSTGVADVSRSIDDVSRVVPHPAGTLVVLPNLIGEPVAALSTTDLEPLSDGEADLPAGASAIDGDVSPDGSVLAVLVTWVIERESDASREIEFVRADDGELITRAEVGWGWGLAAIPGRVLVVDGAGVTFVDRSGDVHPGDPAPEPDRYIDRILSIAPITDAPPFTRAVPTACSPAAEPAPSTVTPPGYVRSYGPGVRGPHARGADVAR